MNEIDYKKVEEAIKVLLESNVRFVLSYPDKDGNCKVASYAGYNILSVCVSGAMAKFATFSLNKGHSDAEIAANLSYIGIEAIKAAKEKFNQDEAMKC